MRNSFKCLNEFDREYVKIIISLRKSILKLMIGMFYTHLSIAEYWYATPVSYSALIYLFVSDTDE